MKFHPGMIHSFPPFQTTIIVQAKETQKANQETKTKKTRKRKKKDIQSI